MAVLSKRAVSASLRTHRFEEDVIYVTIVPLNYILFRLLFELNVFKFNKKNTILGLNE